ncbi:MAG: hypothetical protein QXO40_03565 [Candidatus Aenigmatarchaeota archaeon]
MSKEDAFSFNREISKLEVESSLEGADEKFKRIYKGYRNECLGFINRIIEKVSYYLEFTYNIS